MKITKFCIKAIALLFVVLAIMFVGYGVSTDCPNTATYVHCTKE